MLEVARPVVVPACTRFTPDRKAKLSESGARTGLTALRKSDFSEVKAFAKPPHELIWLARASNTLFLPGPQPKRLRRYFDRGALGEVAEQNLSSWADFRRDLLQPQSVPNLLPRCADYAESIWPSVSLTNLVGCVAVLAERPEVHECVAPGLSFGCSDSSGCSGSSHPDRPRPRCPPSVYNLNTD